MSPAIVVLTDFFAVSNRALSYAAGLAVPLQAHLVLLHVHHDGLLAPEAYRASPTQAGKQKAFQALEELASAQPVPAEVDVSEAFLSDAVQEAVHRHHPLLLVLGRPGLANAPQEVVVSTAMDLLRLAPYPLLVVPTVAWDAFPPSRLLLAVDGEPFQLSHPAGAARRLLQALGRTLDVVHVTPDDQSSPDTVELLDNLRQNALIDVDFDPNRLHEVARGHVACGVLEQAATLETDLLVLVARRHCLLGSLFHRSVTAQLIQESPVPLLLLPSED